MTHPSRAITLSPSATAFRRGTGSFAAALALKEALRSPAKHLTAAANV
jgi:hypothetical protein